MIKRKRLQTREQHAQRVEGAREYCQRRKESVGKVNRFNYAIDNMPTDEGHELHHSKGKRYQEYHITSGQNQSYTTNKSLHHPQSRLLKKDYLYADGSHQRHDCRRILNTKSFNTSFQFNQTCYPTTGDRQDIKNSSFQLMANTKNYPQNNQNCILSNSYLRRTAVFQDNSGSYYDGLNQSMQKSRNKLDLTKTEEDLELQYQEIYANNQRQKQKSTTLDDGFQVILPSEPKINENIIINTRPLIHRKSNTVKQKSLSIGKTERLQSLSGNNTQRNTHQSSTKKLDVVRGFQTRKTSPAKIDSVKMRHVSELVTLRSSPKRSPVKIQIDNSLKLIDDFTIKISCKIEELTVSLQTLRLIK